MKDYKIVQMIYNKLHPHDDFHHDHIIVETDGSQIVEKGVRYFFENLDGLYYPAKSYSVALIYAHLIQKYFKEDFFVSLNDPDLFCGNDKFFVPYDKNTGVYDQIIERVGILRSDFALNLNIEQVKKTWGYFQEEFRPNP